MNEIIIITLTWWQLSLFVISIALLAVFIYELLPIIIKRFLSKLKGRIK